ncbi:hypothetical protein M513_10141, partial [Trichuris suis]
MLVGRDAFNMSTRRKRQKKANSVQWRLYPITNANCNSNGNLFLTTLYRDSRIKQCPTKSSLEGMVYVITGGSSGLGLELAKEVAQLGATTVIGSPNEKTGLQAVETIKKSCGDKEVSIQWMELHLDSFAGIFEFAEAFVDQYDRLDCLVNNAGIMFSPYRLTEDGIESHFAVNHLGHVYLTQLLGNMFEMTGYAEQPARIVFVSSGKYKKATMASFNTINSSEGYNPEIAYGRSKLASILYARNLAREFHQANVPVNVYLARPGFVRGTNLGRNVPAILRMFAKPLMWFFGITPKQAVQNLLYCCTAKLLSGAMYNNCEICPYDYDLVNEVNEKYMADYTRGLIQKIILDNGLPIKLYVILYIYNSCYASLSLYLRCSVCLSRLCKSFEEAHRFMAFYEGIGYMIDKPTIVLDIGNAYVKLGFSAELSPRRILPTEQLLCIPKLGPKPLTDLSNGGDEADAAFVHLFYEIFFRHLLLSPKDRRVVIVESVLTPSELRSTMAKVLFTRYEVMSVMFAPNCLCSCLPLGLQTALVVDVGYRGTQVLPVFDGISLLHSIQTSTAGSQAVHRRLKELIQKRCTVFVGTNQVSMAEYGELLDDKTLENLAARLCFVTRRERGIAYQTEDENSPQLPEPPPKVEYPLDKEKILIVEGAVREAAAEVLFEHNEDDMSIPQLILEAIIKCPIDTRRSMIEGILVVGGGCMLPGFMSRLKEELLESLENATKYGDKLSFRTAKFFKARTKENCMAWLGGSIIGSLEILPYRSVSRTDYEKSGRITDWIDQSMANLSRAAKMNVPSGLQVSNPLHVQWNPPWNPNWINASNVLEYFTNTMNPFYDPNCLNEQIRMQRLSPEVLSRASGVEYALLFACEPLFVIRKQYRQANQTITPMEDYYIIGGTVYQAPDLCSVLNSRLQASIEHLRTAFEEAKSFYRFHPAKGYYWQFRNESTVEKKSKFILKSTVANMLFLDLAAKKSKENVVEDVRASLYQRQRMDTLIGDLVNKFPLPLLEEVGDMDSMEKALTAARAATLLSSTNRCCWLYQKKEPMSKEVCQKCPMVKIETNKQQRKLSLPLESAVKQMHIVEQTTFNPKDFHWTIANDAPILVQCGSEASLFDRTLHRLVVETRRRMDNGHSLQSSCQMYKCLPGRFGLVVELGAAEPCHHRRPNFHMFRSVSERFSAYRFNFLKLCPNEILMQINEWPKSNDAQGWHKIIMTTKLRGHKPLLAPFMDKRLPQMLTAEGLRTAVKTLLLSNCRQLALGFNSPLAMCEVNHLHFELLYCPYSSKFSDQSAEKVADGLYVLKEWLLPAIAVQMTAQNLNQFIRQCLLVSNHFVETNQPFNMILGRSPLLDSNGETIDKSLPVTSYFFPRQAVSPISPKTSLCPSAADMRAEIVRVDAAYLALVGYVIIVHLSYRNAAKCFSWCQHERLLSNASSPMNTVESVDKMVMTTTAEANGHLDEVMHQGTDVTSDDSVCNESPRITTGYYLSHTGYTVPSYSPIMHHRPVNIEYVPIHRSGSCQSCCCSSTQFCGQIPQAYAHPMAPCAPIVGGLCTYAASNNVDQSHPQHPPPPTSIMYPSMVPSVFATPYSPACCPHHGPFAASIQPIPFAGCSIDPSNISQQKSHGRVESPLVSTSDTSSMSDASSKMGKVSENELTTKEDELTGNNGGGAAPPEESLPLSVESLHDGTQPISQRYVTGAKLEREHGRTPLFGDTPSWWNQEEVAKCQSKQGDHPIVAQENDQPNSSLPRDEVGVLPEQPSQKKQEKGEEPLGQPEETANTYKASIRMDIPFAPVLTGKANHNNSGKENCHSSESHRTAAFTIQFNEDHSTNMVAIEKESTRSYQRLHMPRGKPSTTKMKVPKPKPVEEEVPTKASVNEAVDDDAVSECGTYTVDDDCSYAKNQQLYDVETAGDGADDRNALLKELIKISSGEKQQKVGAKQCVTTSKSGPSSPITRRTNSASQIVHTTKGAVGGQTAAQNFRRSDGGRFSMRSKVTMSPGRTIGGGSSKNYANKGQEVRPETLAWLRRKEYNPLKSAGAPSTRGSTSSDTRILNKHERPVGKFERESEYSNFSRSKSFHASTHRSSTANRRQDSTTTKEGAKSVVSSPSSLRGQVFVQLGSLKRIQMLSVDLMTSASGLKEKIRDSVGQLDDVEEDGNEVTSTPSAECPCPLSDVIKKLTVVDKTLKVTHRMVNQMLSQSKSPIVGNESTV